MKLLKKLGAMALSFSMLFTSGSGGLPSGSDVLPVTAQETSEAPEGTGNEGESTSNQTEAESASGETVELVSIAKDNKVTVTIQKLEGTRWVTVNGSSTTVFEIGDDINIKLQYTIPSEVLRPNQEYTYQLPSVLSFKDDLSTEIMQGDTEVGIATVNKNGLVTFKLNGKVNPELGLAGTAEFSGKVGKVREDSDTIFEFPGSSKTISFKKTDPQLSVEKDYDQTLVRQENGAWKIKYSVKVGAKLGSLGPIYFEDHMAPEKSGDTAKPSIDFESIKVKKAGEDSYFDVIEEWTDGFKLRLEELAEGEGPYIITYDVIVNDPQIKPENFTVIKNNAVASVGSFSDHDDKEVEFKSDLQIDKQHDETYIQNLDSKTVTYTITLNTTMGSGGEITLTDFFSEYEKGKIAKGEFKLNSVEVTKNNAVDDSEWSVTKKIDQDGQMILGLTELKAGEEYVITYQVDFPNSVIQSVANNDGISTIPNKVFATVEGVDSTPAEDVVTFNSGLSVIKTSGDIKKVVDEQGNYLNKRSIPFTIAVSSDSGTGSTVKVEDTLGSGLKGSIDTENVKVYKLSAKDIQDLSEDISDFKKLREFLSSRNSLTLDETENELSITDSHFSITLPALSAGDVYFVTYEVIVNDEDIAAKRNPEGNTKTEEKSTTTAKAELTNDVTVTSGKLSDETQKIVEILSDISVSKTVGSISENEDGSRDIPYTVVVSSENGTIEQVTVSDALQGFSGSLKSLTIKKIPGGEIDLTELDNEAGTGELFKYTLDPLQAGESYKIIYTVTVSAKEIQESFKQRGKDAGSVSGTAHILNNAKAVSGKMEADFETTTDVPGDLTVSKQAVETTGTDGSQRIEYTIDLSTTDGTAGPIAFKDILSMNGTPVKGAHIDTSTISVMKVQSDAEEQPLSPEPEFKYIRRSGNENSSDSNETGEDPDEDDDPDDASKSEAVTNTDVIGFEGELPKLDSGSYKISYEVVIDNPEEFYGEANSARLTNTASGKLGSNEAQVKKDTSIEKLPAELTVEKTAENPVVQEDGSQIIKYEVTMSSTDGTQTDIVFTDTITTNNAEIIDGNTAYPITVSKGGKSITLTEPLRVSGNGRILSGTLPALKAGESYKITYFVRVSKEVLDDNKTVVIKNIATGKFYGQSKSNEEVVTIHSWDLNVSKSLVSNEDIPGNEGYISGKKIGYKVIIQSPEFGSRNDIDFSDYISPEISVSIDGKVIVKKYNIIKDTGKLDEDNVLSEEEFDELSFTLPALEAGQAYVVTYSLTISREELDKKENAQGDGSVFITNTATANKQSGSTGNKEIREPQITKNSTANANKYDEDYTYAQKHEIKYTINIAAGNKGKELKDLLTFKKDSEASFIKLPDKFLEEIDVEIGIKDGSDGAIGTIEKKTGSDLNKGYKLETNYAYVITYTVNYDTILKWNESGTFHNEATLGDFKASTTETVEKGTPGAGKSQQMTVTGEGDNSEETPRESEVIYDSKGKTLEQVFYWTSTITLPREDWSEFTFVDNFDQGVFDKDGNDLDKYKNAKHYALLSELSKELSQTLPTEDYSIVIEYIYPSAENTSSDKPEQDSQVSDKGPTDLQEEPQAPVTDPEVIGFRIIIRKKLTADNKTDLKDSYGETISFNYSTRLKTPWNENPLKNGDDYTVKNTWTLKDTKTTGTADQKFEYFENAWRGSKSGISAPEYDAITGNLSRERFDWTTSFKYPDIEWTSVVYYDEFVQKLFNDKKLEENSGEAVEQYALLGNLNTSLKESLDDFAKNGNYTIKFYSGAKTGEITVSRDGTLPSNANLKAKVHSFEITLTKNADTRVSGTVNLEYSTYVDVDEMPASGTRYVFNTFTLNDTKGDAASSSFEKQPGWTGTKSGTEDEEFSTYEELENDGKTYWGIRRSINWSATVGVRVKNGSTDPINPWKTATFKDRFEQGLFKDSETLEVDSVHYALLGTLHGQLSDTLNIDGVSWSATYFDKDGKTIVSSLTANSDISKFADKKVFSFDINLENNGNGPASITLNYQSVLEVPKYSELADKAFTVKNHFEIGDTKGDGTSSSSEMTDWSATKSKTGYDLVYTGDKVNRTIFHWSAEITPTVENAWETFIYEDVIGGLEDQNNDEGTDQTYTHFAYLGDLKTQLAKSVEDYNGDNQVIKADYIFYDLKNNKLPDDASNESKVGSFKVLFTNLSGEETNRSIQLEYVTLLDTPNGLDAGEYRIVNSFIHNGESEDGENGEFEKNDTLIPDFAKLAKLATDTVYTSEPIDLNNYRVDEPKIIDYRLQYICPEHYYQSSPLSITDVLPKEMELVDNKVEVVELNNGSVSKVLGADLYDLDIVENEKEGTKTIQVTIDWKLIQGKTIAVQYSCQIKPSAQFNEGVLNVTNRAETSSGDEAEHSVKVTVKMVEKEGNQIVENGRFTNKAQYTVTVNPSGADLVPGSDTITLEDTITLCGNDGNPIEGRLILDHDDFKVIPYVDGENNEDPDEEPEGINPNLYRFTLTELDEGEDGYIKYKLEVILPDATPCQVKYTYIVDTTDSNGDSESQPILKNEANLFGKVSDDKDISWEIVNASASVLQTTVPIYKVDADNYGVSLPGAKFAVYKWNFDEVQWDSVGEVETDGSGMLIFDENSKTEELRYAHGAIYALYETEAPLGYIKSDKVYFFSHLAVEGEADTTEADVWAKFERNGINTLDAFLKTEVPHTKTAPETKSTVKFFSGLGGDIYIPNESMGLTVQKIWRKEDGTLDKTAHDPITLNIYRKTTVNEEEPDLFAKITLGAGNESRPVQDSAGVWIYATKEWTFTIEKVKDGPIYYYLVEEPEMDDYTVTYSENDGYLSAGLVTITNTRTGLDEGYFLPEAGNIGTIAFAVGGVSFTAVTAYAIVLRRRKYRLTK